MRSMMTVLMALGLGFSFQVQAASCVAQADEKKLAGAARNSFMQKCEREQAAAAPPSAAVVCGKQADEKKLAGAARSSFLQKCEREHGAAAPAPAPAAAGAPGTAGATGAASAAAQCDKQADEKKLAGAARNSFITKCQKDAAGG